MDQIQTNNQLKVILDKVNNQKQAEVDYSVLNNSSLKIDYKNELNDDQLAACTNLSGPILCIAGAGTGKTRTLVYRVSLMLEKGINPEEILLLTFTKKAAGEMLQRVSTLVNHTLADRVTGGTFHSFACSILRKYSHLTGSNPNFSILDSVDSQDLVNMMKKELDVSKAELKLLPKKAGIFKVISKARNCDIDLMDVLLEEYPDIEFDFKLISILEQKYTQYKKSHNMYDFDDLLFVFKDLLISNPEFLSMLHSKFNYILVDEYQDTNIVQKQIVNLLASKNRNILVVGDENQSIYMFRGATVVNILGFPLDYPDCKIVKLESNYRSRQDILDFTNSISQNFSIGYKKILKSTKVANGMPIVKRTYNQLSEADFVVDIIEQILDQGAELRDIAVLYRSSFHSNYVQNKLTAKGFDYVVFGGIRFAERSHIKDVLSVLRVIQNRSDEISWTRCLTLLPAVGPGTADKIIKAMSNTPGLNIDAFKKTKAGVYLEEINNLITYISKSTVTEALTEIKRFYMDIIKAKNYTEEIMSKDIDILIEMSKNYRSLNKFITDFSLEPPSNKGSQNTLIKDAAGDKITLSTIHSFKGLERKFIICIHNSEGLFPSFQSQKKPELMDEERRLFYVACTRAEELLVLTIPQTIGQNNYYTEPSRFVQEIEKERYYFYADD